MMRKRHLFILSAFLFLFLLMVGCQKDETPFIEIIAEVGEHTLTRDQLNQWLPPNLPEDQRNVVARKYVDRWVQRTSLALSAQNEGLSLSSYEEWAIHNLKKEMLAQKFLDSKLPGEIIVTEEEISDYYEKNKDEFIRNHDEAHVVQLFLENLDRAIVREIRESKSLLEVIEKNYLNTQGTRLLEKNGDIGYVPVENLHEKIVRQAKYGKTGRIYGPIKLESGHYYFQMLDKQEQGSHRNLELVKEQIRLRLVNIKREKMTEDIADELKEKYAAKIYSEHIK